MREIVEKIPLTENCSKEDICTFVESVIPQLTTEEKIGIMSGQITEKKLLDDLFVMSAKRQICRRPQRRCSRKRYLFPRFHSKRSNI